MYSELYRISRLMRPNEWKVRQYTKQLEQMEWLSQGDLQVWQLSQLKEVISYAYDHVPFYRRRYLEAGITPQDINSLVDFQALPFLTKEDIKNHLDELISPEFQGKVFTNETGGSTGEPTQFVVEDSFWRWNVAHRDRSRRWYGVEPGDKMALVWGAPRDMPDQSWQRRLRAQIMRHRVLNAFSMTQDKMQSFADMLVHWQPAMFKAYPSALALFARFLEEQGITEIRPRLIETTAEKTTEPQRELFQRVFQCPVADCYSSRELATIGYQCPDGALHVCETRYLEIVTNDQITPSGQLGEVVITSLHQFAMPLIRYKIGDLGISQDVSCECGRGLPALKEVVGRTHDFLVTADGEFVHGEFFAYTFRVKPEVVRYQVYQPDKTHLEIRLVCKQNMDETWLNNVRSEIQNRFGESTQISIQLVDQIKLTTAGKHRYIISDVTPDFL